VSPPPPSHLAVLLALLGAGCRGREGDILTVAADGAAPSPPPACSAAARTILVLDRDGRLASYDPRADSLHDRASIAASVPRPDCPMGSRAATVSLAVDRQGAAWVADCDGDLLKCDPSSGLCSGGWSSRPLPRSVRMAWAADPAGEQALFLAAAPDPLPAFPAAPAESTLLRFPSLERAVATLAGWPALTGTSDQLWALFPGDARRGVDARLAALDATTGREIEQRDTTGTVIGPLPALLAASGADFWVFQSIGTVTVVQRARAGGQANDTTHAIGRRIVAVASSPCGP
jgi:hypothetical protein